jgi:hypothetical protein
VKKLLIALFVTAAVTTAYAADVYVIVATVKSGKDVVQQLGFTPGGQPQKIYGTEDACTADLNSDATKAMEKGLDERVAAYNAEHGTDLSVEYACHDAAEFGLHSAIRGATYAVK